MIRVAAVADVHVGEECRGQLRERFEHIADHADLLLIGGDLTRCGSPTEAAVLAEGLVDLPVPAVAVLGNHDYHADAEAQVRKEMERADVTVLEGEATTLDVSGTTVGIAGAKGFGGGFAGACATEFGEREIKDFVATTRRVADRMGECLDGLRTDVRIALLHYAPVPQTLHGEPLEIYPFLGSYLLAKSIDEAGADAVFHGHAHRGSERGRTPGGVPVRNVAQQVINAAYRVYEVGAHAG